MAKKTIAIVLLLAMFVLSFVACAPTLDESDTTDIAWVDNFKIMVLADLQFSNVEDGKVAFQLVDRMVDEQKPNLIVLTGDNLGNPKSERVVDFLIESLDKYCIPYAPVFGNHDSEGGVEKHTYAQKFAKSQYCKFLPGKADVDGVGNYVVNLTDDGQIKFSLYFFDSNTYRDDGYDYIYPSQIEWYKQRVDQTNQKANKSVNSFAFFHIPLVEFDLAKQAFERGDLQGYGIFKETPCPPVENTGLFDVMKQKGSTKAIFCGHDHVNNCDLSYQGIRLNYCLKSSRFSYFDEDMIGTTVITIASDGNFVVEQKHY